MVRMEIHFLAMIQQTKISKSIRRQQIITYSSTDRYVLRSGFLVPLRQNACKFKNKLVNGSGFSNPYHGLLSFPTT